MRVAKDSSLEMYQMPNGNYGVLLNGKLIAKVVNCGERSGWTPDSDLPKALGWQVMSQTAAHQNGRMRHETPQKAVKAYFGRKITIINPSDMGEIPGPAPKIPVR
jgi:hypothetical protein